MSNVNTSSLENNHFILFVIMFCNCYGKKSLQKEVLMQCKYNKLYFLLGFTVDMENLWKKLIFVLFHFLEIETA